MNWIDRYAFLLADYSLYLKPGEKVFVRANTLAEPLLIAFQREAIKKGAIVEIDLSMPLQEEYLLEYGSEDQLNYIPPSILENIKTCDAYLFIRASYDAPPLSSKAIENSTIRNKALSAFSDIYFERLGNGSLKRSLCQFPTSHAAHLADMSMEEYTDFIIHACHLHHEDPKSEWLKLSAMQQGIVDYLNQVNEMEYRHPDFSIRFQVKDRIWINSDGKSNMPSGEVFTSPIEDSVNGEIFFNYPTIMKTTEVQGIKLFVKDGEIYKWSANKGQEVLDAVFAIDGAKRFGEVAIGTNQNLQRATKNILFDEKIGGTVHMAVGQSYYQCGGKNKSAIHWDLITDMRKGGEIYADGELIYKDGNFIRLK